MLIVRVGKKNKGFLSSRIDSCSHVNSHTPLSIDPNCTFKMFDLFRIKKPGARGRGQGGGGQEIESIGNSEPLSLSRYGNK